MFSVSQAADRFAANSNPIQTGTLVGIELHWSPRPGEAGRPTGLPLVVESLLHATSIRFVANTDSNPANLMTAYVSLGQMSHLFLKEMPHAAALDNERSAKLFIKWLGNLLDRKVRINRKTSFLQYLAPKDLVPAAPVA